MGTWDHEELEMNEPPHWQLFVLAAANARLGGIQVAYADARNELRQLQEQANRGVADALERTIRDMLEGPLEDLQNIADNLTDELDRKAQREKQKLESEIRAIDRELADVKQRIRALERRRDEATAEKDKESIEFRIKVQRNKLDRLELLIESLRRERDAVD
jgi:chromosome segregation ATPase